MLSVRRDLAAAKEFFTRALSVGRQPVEVTTDRAHSYPRVLDEQLPAALHVVERYANNPIEADHRRLKARLRPMRGLQPLRSAQTVGWPRLRAKHSAQPLRSRHRRICTRPPSPNWHGAFDQVTQRVSAASDQPTQQRPSPGCACTGQLRLHDQRVSRRSRLRGSHRRGPGGWGLERSHSHGGRPHRGGCRDLDRRARDSAAAGGRHCCVDPSRQRDAIGRVTRAHNATVSRS